MEGRQGKRWIRGEYVGRKKIVFVCNVLNAP